MPNIYGSIVTLPATDAYREGWERTFGKQQEEQPVSPLPEEATDSAQDESEDRKEGDRD